MKRESLYCTSQRVDGSDPTSEWGSVDSTVTWRSGLSRAFATTYPLPENSWAVVFYMFYAESWHSVGMSSWICWITAVRWAFRSLPRLSMRCSYTQTCFIFYTTGFRIHFLTSRWLFTVIIVFLYRIHLWKAQNFVFQILHCGVLNSTKYIYFRRRRFLKLITAKHNL